MKRVLLRLIGSFWDILTRYIACAHEDTRENDWVKRKYNVFYFIYLFYVLHVLLYLYEFFMRTDNETKRKRNEPKRNETNETR